MSKELPYFKFQASEWVTGDITLCSMETQGLFINLCCYYWIRDCNISLANAKQRFSNCFSLVEELLNKEIILLNDDEKIIIKFLDEQMEKFIDISKKRSKSGALKGKHLHIKSKAIAPYKEKERDKEKDINILFDVFWNLYNRKEGSKKRCESKWNKLSDIERQKIIDTLPSFMSQIRDKQFQPFPETYLNQERWNDEIAIKPDYFVAR